MIDAIQREIAPIAQSIIEYESDLGSVKRIVAEGSEQARDEASKTLHEVRLAIGLDY
ncbi:MAG: hypothetical protein NTW94_01160 [Legionellales bacterium]|nr:hypothetical protein [Legionellales bacterium]